MTPPTLAELQRLPRDCPLVYDNDWLKDTNDDEYVFAKAHLGQANLKGIVLTKDLWNGGKQYKVDDGLKDFRENLDIVRRSGWKNLPEITVGADRVFARPTSGKVEDTAPVDSPGARLLVDLARRASPAKPVVVFVGGPLNTVASACLMDPTIAPKLIVLMTDLTAYNGQDRWANTIVATRCRMANFGASPLWWPQRPQPPIMPVERFDGLPDTPVTQEMRRVARMFWERSTRKERPDRDDGLADGAGPMLFFAPRTWRAVRKVRVTGTEPGVFATAEAANGQPYHYLDATRVDFDAMREEFFATITAALRGTTSDKKARK